MVAQSVVVLSLALVSTATWASPEAAVKPAATVQQKGQASGSGLQIGATLDVGVPDLLGVSLVVRPWEWVRLHAGGSTSIVGAGLRGGITIVPFHAAFTPSLTVEGGRLFDGNANLLTKRFGVQSPALDRVGYTYGSAHLGLEMGSPDSIVFFVHGGVSAMRSTLRNTQQVVQDETGIPTLTFDNPKVSAIVPSAKIGLLVYL